MNNPCVAHRGWSGKAPENTLAAIKMALQLEQVKAVEIDVQLSRDGVPVVIHDFTLHRTTDGKGWVKDQTFEVLRKLDAGSWFSDAYKGQRIPSLEEVLELVKGRCYLNIELKTAGDMYPHMEEKVLEAIQSSGMTDQVWITSFDHTRVKRVKELNPQIQTGLIIEGLPLLLVDQLKEANANMVSMNHKFLYKDVVEQLNSAGYGLMAWTVNDAKRMEQISALDPNIMICTNHPDLM